MELHSIWSQRARLLVLAILGAYFLLLLGLGGHSAWKSLGVPPMPPPSTSFAPTSIFADTRVITSGWECSRRGDDVLRHNTCDPWQRTTNYPRIWLAPSFLGLGQGSTVPLGLLIAVVFFAAALAVLGARASLGTAMVYTAVLCSPAVMLGVERGNVDLLIFGLLVLAVLLFRRGRSGRYWTSGLILVASVLKLYPIFVAGLLARQRRRVVLLSLGAVVALFLAYTLATLHDVRLIAKATPQTDYYSYGLNMIGRWLSTVAPALRPPVWDALIVLVSAVVVLAVRNRLRLSPTADPLAQRDLDLFWVGAIAYVSTYMLFRNFDYRMVFLLLTIPSLVRWTRQRKALGGGTLAVLLAAVWLHGETLGAAAVPQLLLFVALLAGLSATLPGRASAPRRRSSWSGPATWTQ